MAKERCSYCGNGLDYCENGEYCRGHYIYICCCCQESGKNEESLVSDGKDRFIKAKRAFAKLDKFDKEEFLEWAVEQI